MPDEKVIEITIDAKTLLLVAISVAVVISLISVYASPWITEHEKAPSLDIIDFKVKVIAPNGTVFLYDCDTDLITPGVVNVFKKYNATAGVTLLGTVNKVKFSNGSKVIFSLTLSAAAGYFAPYGPYVSYYLYPYGYYYPYYAYPYAYYYYFFPPVKPLSFTAIVNIWFNKPSGVYSCALDYNASSMLPDAIKTVDVPFLIPSSALPGCYNASIYVWDALLPSGGLRKAIDSGFYIVPLEVVTT